MEPQRGASRGRGKTNAEFLVLECDSTVHFQQWVSYGASMHVHHGAVLIVALPTPSLVLCTLLVDSFLLRLTASCFPDYSLSLQSEQLACCPLYPQTVTLRSVEMTVKFFPGQYPTFTLLHECGSRPSCVTYYYYNPFLTSFI